MTATPNAPMTLIGRPGWGSAIIELQLAHYGLPHVLQDSGDLLDSEDARASLRPLNPLAQVPVLLLPDGTVMTESAAITLHLADITQRDDLVPGPTAPERAAFLRWLVFLVANIYPTFTYGDIPTRFVPEETAAEAFEQTLNAYARKLWCQVEGEVKGPCFLGDRFTALDIYLLVMMRWRPGKAWFAENAPLLHAAFTRANDIAQSTPALAQVMQRNFPKG